MSKESDIEKLVVVATFPPSFLPSGTYAFYFINRPPWANVLSLSVHHALLNRWIDIFILP